VIFLEPGDTRDGGEGLRLKRGGVTLSKREAGDAVVQRDDAPSLWKMGYRRCRD
jgi:hypothetical protein